MGTDRNDVLDEPLNRLELKGRTLDCLTDLYGSETTVREIITIPFPDLTEDVRKKHVRPGIIINDLAQALSDIGWLLGTHPDVLTPPTQRVRELQYLRAYPHISRRESARTILWFWRNRYEALKDGWATKDMSAELLAFEGQVVHQERINAFLIMIGKQKWKRLDGNSEPFSIGPKTTYGDVLAAYFRPD